MSKTEFIALLAVIIQPISIGISYYLGGLVSKSEKKKQILTERYDNFYVPYIKLLYQRTYHLPTTIFLLEAMPQEAIFPFENLIEENIKYLDNETLKLYPTLLEAGIDFMEYDSGNIAFVDAPIFRKMVFLLIASSIIKQASLIAHELKLPDITLAFPDEYKRSSHIDKYRKVLHLYLKNKLSKEHKKIT